MHILLNYKKLIQNEVLFYFLILIGESMKIVPHYQKSFSQFSHIWGNLRGQHICSAMGNTDPGNSPL